MNISYCNILESAIIWPESGFMLEKVSTTFTDGDREKYLRGLFDLAKQGKPGALEELSLNATAGSEQAQIMVRQLEKPVIKNNLGDNT